MKRSVCLRIEELEARDTPSGTPFAGSVFLPPGLAPIEIGDRDLLPPPIARGVFLPPGLGPNEIGNPDLLPPPIAGGVFVPPGLQPPPDSDLTFLPPAPATEITHGS